MHLQGGGTTNTDTKATRLWVSLRNCRPWYSWNPFNSFSSFSSNQKWEGKLMHAVGEMRLQYTAAESSWGLQGNNSTRKGEKEFTCIIGAKQWGTFRGRKQLTLWHRRMWTVRTSERDRLERPSIFSSMTQHNDWSQSYGHLNRNNCKNIKRNEMIRNRYETIRSYSLVEQLTTFKEVQRQSKRSEKKGKGSIPLIQITKTYVSLEWRLKPPL